MGASASSRRRGGPVARIDHPGVVAIFDSGELEDGCSFS